MDNEQQNIYQLYEANIGMIVPMIKDMLMDAEQEYPITWIEKAISIAVKANHRNWRYVEAILKRWKVDGMDDGLGNKSMNKDRERLSDAGRKRYAEWDK